jgi:amino acid transporter
MTEAPSAPVSAGAKKGNGLAVAGMILGIVALGLFCIIYVSVPCAIVGLILSILGSKKAKETGSGKGMAKAGMILAIIALALTLLAFFGLLAFLGIAAKEGSDLGQALEEARKAAENMPAPPAQPAP